MWLCKEAAVDYRQGGAEDYEVRWTDIIFCYFICARREQRFSAIGRENRVRPCARMCLCPPPIKSHEDLSHTIETNKTTTTPRNINSNNLMH